MDLFRRLFCFVSRCRVRPCMLRRISIVLLDGIYPSLIVADSRQVEPYSTCYYIVKDGFFRH